MSSSLAVLTRTRRTRIVCISDTHRQTPKLPAGDVLIHAGDLTNQGTVSELKGAVEWLEKADFEAKIVIAGNHDITLDEPFYSQYGQYFHNQNPQDISLCASLLKQSPTITYLDHESTTVKLTSPTGAQTTFTVFGSPYSPYDLGTSSPANGRWGFQYDYGAEDAEYLWNKIPLNTDVLITHTPPYNHCDLKPSGRSLGCEALRKALWRVRPRLHVCGHVHEGRGGEVVSWRVDWPHVQYCEEKVDHWIDPGVGVGNKKMSLYDLTGKSGGVALHNDGVALEVGGDRQDVGDVSNGRLGRKETCIVNAAVMGTSFGGPKAINKPIVVDIELPISNG